MNISPPPTTGEATEAVTRWREARNGYQTGTRIIINADGRTEVQVLMRPDPSQRPTQRWWWRWVTLPHGGLTHGH